MSNHLAPYVPPEAELPIPQDTAHGYEQLALTSQRLSHGVDYVLDGTPFTADDKPSVIAILDTSNSVSAGVQLEIIDMRSAPTDKDGNKIYGRYRFTPDTSAAIVSMPSEYDGKTRRGVVGLTEGSTFTFGRASSGLDMSGQFPVDNTTSSNHCSITAAIDGRFIVRDTSKNGTSLHARAEAMPLGSVGEVDNGRQGRLMGRLARVALRRSNNEVQGRLEVVSADATSESLQTARALLKIETFIQSSLNPGHVITTSKKQRLEELRLRAQEIIHKNPENAGMVANVLVENKFEGKSIPGLLGKWGQGDKELKQKRLLAMYEADPDTAREIIERNVVGFHGTQSGALLSMIAHGGLLSAKEAIRRGENLATGERIFSPLNGSESISFADWRCAGTMELYARLPGEEERTLESIEREIGYYNRQIDEYVNAGFDPATHPFIYNSKSIIADMQFHADKIKQDPDSLESQLYIKNFPVTIGVNIDDIATVPTFFDKDKIAKIRAENKPYVVERSISDIDGEFVVNSPSLGFDRLPIVGVPKEHISLVRRLLHDAGYVNTRVVDYNTLVV